jgi:tetratricopeptide (TPR) repeat protein
MEESTERITLLIQILEQNPTDVFARYGLAMEHLSSGNSDNALIEFAKLIELNPDYVPAYQMSAQALVKLERIEEAIARLDDGIAAADRTGNQYALSEMQGLRDSLI